MTEEERHSPLPEIEAAAEKIARAAAAGAELHIVLRHRDTRKPCALLLYSGNPEKVRIISELLDVWERRRV